MADGPAIPADLNDTARSVRTMDVSANSARVNVAGTGAHVPALDGVRGIAIFLVLMVHYLSKAAGRGEFGRWGKATIGSGWIGVDLFFVLSGFLITGILLDAKGTPHYFRNFYARRTLRIFPLYYGVLFVGLIVIPLLFPGAARMLKPITSHQIWLWTYTTNVYQAIVNSGVFFAGPVIASHLWTLAVEEHFYLVWPAVVYGFRRRPFGWICFAVVCGAPLLRWAMLECGANERAVYVLTPCRADSLAIGGLLAFLVRYRPRWVARYAGVVALCSGGILFAEFYRHQGLHHRFPSMETIGYSVVAIFFASMLALVLRDSRRNVLRTSMSWLPLRLIGRYSYGMYVLHRLSPPLLAKSPFAAAIASVDSSPVVRSLMNALMGTLITAGLAATSYYLYEMPFLRLKRFFEYRPREPVHV